MNLRATFFFTFPVLCVLAIVGGCTSTVETNGNPLSTPNPPHHPPFGPDSGVPTPPWDAGPGDDWDVWAPTDGGSWDAPIWDAMPDGPNGTIGIPLPSGCGTNGATPIDAWVAFDSDRDNGVSHIFVGRPDGCDVRQLTFGPYAEEEPAFAPDGLYVAFSSDRDGSRQIWRMELATKSIKKVTAIPNGAQHPSYSPDGTLITFESLGGIYTVHPDGTAPRLIAQEGTQCCTAYESPTFSHDGTQLLFDRTNEIDAVNLDGSGKRYVVSNWTTTEQDPAASPDGFLVAYAVYCGAGQAIFAAPFNGLPGDPCSGQRITPDSFGTSRHPSWGPSNLVAFERTGTARVAIIDTKTGTAWELLNETSRQAHPSWATPGWQP
jgi:Tol biopolymer transport system component